ncbi:uncharacterized protein LOC109930956, partial [Rhincodon typus]|uniref:uncharacterized protein LOC109930956 n=1 Tax=Rhincodon typus TaxID=259920 RepID=UPI002030EE13
VQGSSLKYDISSRSLSKIEGMIEEPDSDSADPSHLDPAHLSQNGSVSTPTLRTKSLPTKEVPENLGRRKSENGQPEISEMIIAEGRSLSPGPERSSLPLVGKVPDGQIMTNMTKEKQKTRRRKSKQTSMTDGPSPDDFNITNTHLLASKVKQNLSENSGKPLVRVRRMDSWQEEQIRLPGAAGMREVKRRLMGEKGEPGHKGDEGEIGEKGQKGEPGIGFRGPIGQSGSPGKK